MYVASAVYADHAGTANTAANALKLGGYDAAAYMRKDEVKTIKSSYETLEWDGAGTYSWTVPEGVTKINVTTVGGGGGGSMIRTTAYRTTRPLNMYTGGNGGEVIENVVLNVNTNDVITIRCGQGGRTISHDYQHSMCDGFYPSPSRDWNRAGGHGEDSYVSINGVQQSATYAHGGYPGSTKLTPNIVLDNANTPIGYRAIPNPVYPGGGAGGCPLTLIAVQYLTETNGIDGKIGSGGKGTLSSVSVKTGELTYHLNPCTGQYEYYVWGGGGGSYGNGLNADDQIGTVATRGGGGITHNNGNLLGPAGGDGYIKITYTRLYSD